MAPNRPNPPTRSSGIVLPPIIRRIVESSNEHPELGRQFDRINAHYETQRRRLVGQREENCHIEVERQLSSEMMALRPDSPENTVNVEGPICIVSPNSSRVVKCTGHVISIDPKDGEYCTIVLDIPEERFIPCRCPVSLLNPAAHDAVRALQKRRRTKTDRYSRKLEKISIESKVAVRDNLRGHFLTDACTVKGLKGRVVDNKMLAALEGGCLRIGNHSRSHRKKGEEWE